MHFQLIIIILFIISVVCLRQYYLCIQKFMCMSFKYFSVMIVLLFIAITFTKLKHILIKLIFIIILHLLYLNSQAKRSIAATQKPLLNFRILIIEDC